MRWHASAMFLACAVLTAGCTNHRIEFEQLPNGNAVPSWNGSASLSVNDPWVITTQYAPDGVASFQSNGRDGVLVFADSATASPPNTVCPIGVPFGPRDFTGTTTIRLSQPTTNIWLTVPVSHPRVRVTAFDANNNVLRSELSDGPAASSVSGGRRVRLNASGIRRVDVEGAQTGSIYCFDDFTWQERW